MFPSKLWTLRWSIHSYRSCQPGLPRNQTSLQESISLLLTSVTFLRAITMCSAFTPDSWYDKSTVILIGDVYCPDTKCSGKISLFKKTFQSLGRSDYQCPQCASVCQVRNNHFKDQKIFFFLSFAQGVYVFEESPMSIQDAIGDVYCPGEYCLNREMRISCRLWYNSEMHSWLWKVWSLVICSQSSFYVKRARRDDKNRRKPFFLCYKNMNLLPDKYLFIKIPSGINLLSITITRTKEG